MERKIRFQIQNQEKEDLGSILITTILHLTQTEKDRNRHPTDVQVTDHLIQDQNEGLTETEILKLSQCQLNVT